VSRTRFLAVLERLAWMAAVVAATWYLGVGLDKTFYFENTTEALREAEVGLRLIRLASAALVALAGYAWWRGAPTWAWVLVLAAPVVCGGLTELWGESLFPQLGFLVAGPLTVLAALVAVAFRWAGQRTEPTPADVVGSWS
jgi:hypothetical protein